jgi:Phage gp6-like head-tail connector protein
VNVVVLTDLDSVRQWLRLDTADTSDDVFLGDLITAASAAIATYCNRNFGLATYTETYNGNGQPSLFLLQRPVQSVSTVVVNGITITPAQVSGGIGWTNDGACLYLAGGMFWQGNQNVQVTYIAGVPYSSDLAHAATQWVGLMYQQQKHPDKKSDSMGAAGGTTSYLDNMPWMVKLIVDRYRQVSPVMPLGL